ncbi:MAG: universal stress protein [Candidatus Eremiobacteraeota bacterium]|nr:universal stress protein [Candidatus Eremiobacteraeota bacterium]MCW5871200.1 universal stress protein [Candidatus Eremiobacteraeota bacterium]
MNQHPVHVQSLLVPLDGSRAAESALAWAEELAGKHQSEIILLRVGREPNILEVRDIDDLKAFMQRDEEDCRSYLQQVKLRLKSAAFVKVRLEYCLGNPGPAIVRKAAELGASLIVMASHGRDGMARWWLGSVAERVTRHAACPVLLVRQADQA